ncbi:MAG TPA: ABC transporter permease, partial [Alphaproteobacteria bacterium]|nr:ABC transporter permease [Alphaproteobacteria bacterium]
MKTLLARSASVTALALLALLVAAAVAAPVVEAALGLDATATDLLARYRPPSAEHPLGTDEIGRDVLVRLLYGGRVSLSVGLVAAVMAAAIGTLI